MNTSLKQHATVLTGTPPFTTSRTSVWLAATAAVTAALFTSGSAAAAIVEIDESNFVGWVLGAPHQTAQIIYEEELNLPAVRSTGGNILAPAPAVLHLAPEGPGIPMDIEYNLHIAALIGGGIGNGTVVGRKFNIMDSFLEGGGLSDTLTVSFTGLPGNEVDVNLHFFSNPEPGSLTPLNGTPGVDLFTFTESGSNDRLNVLAAGWLPNGIAPADLDVAVRSDIVPEPSAASLCLLMVGLAGLSRRRTTPRRA
ncbi:MAG: PEP-CTERM sorting domain-containing protein [Chthoniobacter sp.]|nr:PEP-CTERM sorting domain-containing protein [Chthoniobacter sp.]